jgi:hypothetical protein
MTNNNPRDGWSLDDEGGSRSAHDTYKDRRARERLSEAVRDAKASARDLLDIARARGDRERG